MMSKTLFSVTAAVAATFLLSACNEKAPSGQVVATVNGEEITLAQLDLEARLRNLPGTSDPSVRNQLLQQVIDRKLLSQSAVEKKLDRDPEYVLMQERDDELRLAAMFLRPMGKGAEPPLEEVDEYARKNAALFDGRQILSVEQIAFAPPTDPEVMRAIEKATSLDDIERILLAAGVRQQREPRLWDSAILPPEFAKTLDQLPPGEPFVIKAANPMVAGLIVGKRQYAVSEQQRRAIAQERLKQQRAAEAVQLWVKGTRRRADIKYQPGFAPAAAKKNAPVAQKQAG